ncbi:MAG: hypothetical protein LBR80_16450 [Deltaproteobacteria bacterium]|nr:hypothetical protein [Deltaproteobacteria bacterium]
MDEAPDTFAGPEPPMVAEDPVSLPSVPGRATPTGASEPAAGAGASAAPGAGREDHWAMAPADKGPRSAKSAARATGGTGPASGRAVGGVWLCR